LGIVAKEAEKKYEGKKLWRSAGGKREGAKKEKSRYLQYRLTG
jgi:hypothetical protein